MIGKMKLKKGFTLVELCIVLGIVAVIVALCCTFIVSYHNNVYKIQDSKETMSEMALVKSSIDSWLVVYDSGYYDIEVGEGDSCVINAVESEAARTAGVENIREGSLLFDNGKLLSSGKKTLSVNFEHIKNVSFEKDSGLVIATVTAKNSKTQKLAFVLFSDTERDRYASEERLMVQKAQNTINTWLLNNSRVQSVTPNQITSRSGLTTTYLKFDSSSKQLVATRGLGISKKTYYIGNPDSCTFSQDGNKIICTLVKDGSTEILSFDY